MNGRSLPTRFRRCAASLEGRRRGANSAWAKYANASRRISSAWRSSPISRSSAFTFSATSVGTPTRLPLSTSAFSATHEASAARSRSSPPWTPALPTATGDRARGRAPSAPHARGPRAQTCPSCCSCTLHLLRKWSPTNPGRFMAILEAGAGVVRNAITRSDHHTRPCAGVHRAAAAPFHEGPLLAAGGGPAQGRRDGRAVLLGRILASGRHDRCRPFGTPRLPLRYHGGLS